MDTTTPAPEDTLAKFKEGVRKHYEIEAMRRNVAEHGIGAFPDGQDARLNLLSQRLAPALPYDLFQEISGLPDDALVRFKDFLSYDVVMIQQAAIAAQCDQEAQAWRARFAAA